MRAALILIICVAACGCATTERAPPQFQIGDVAIARNFTHHPELNGTYVRVTGGYEWRWIKGGNTLRTYAVTTSDGQQLAAQSFQLQRIVASASSSE
jgi:hypothetical protein